MDKTYAKRETQLCLSETNTLKSIFLPLQKGKNIENREKKMIYKIPCKNCDSVYIGETSRDKTTRMREHQKNIKTNDPNSKVATHANINGHELDFGNVMIPGKESDWRRRVIKESLFTQGTFGKSYNDIKHTIRIFG
jgi:hypothetical protein